MQNTIKIIIRSPIFSISGYSDYSRTITKVLDSNPNIDLRIEPVYGWGASAILTKEENDYFNEILSRPAFTEKEIPEVYYFMVHLPTQYPIQENINFFKYKKRINLTMFETDNILNQWAELINKYCDLLLLPTEFNVETFGKKCSVPMASLTFTKFNFDVDLKAVTPNPPYILNSSDKPDSGKPSNSKPSSGKPFIYYHNCDFGTRKGPYEVVKGYLTAMKELNQAGSLSDLNSTQLWVKWYKDHSEAERVKFYSFIQSIRGEVQNYSSPIYLLHENMLPHQLDAIYNSIDCYIQPAKGEGLNLPAIEAILHLKPVVLSEWSSHVSLLKDCEHYNNWIKGDVAIIQNIPDPFYAPEAHKEGHNWFYPSFDSVVENYKNIYLNYPSNETLNLIKQHIINKSNPEFISNRFIDLINDIEQED